MMGTTAQHVNELTKYIATFEAMDNPDEQKFPPFEEIADFMSDVEDFADMYEGIRWNNYSDALSEAGLDMSHGVFQSFKETEVTEFDVRGVIALLFWATRMERFCDGFVACAIKDGTIIRWLKRLEELGSGN